MDDEDDGNEVDRLFGTTFPILQTWDGDFLFNIFGIAAGTAGEYASWLQCRNEVLDRDVQDVHRLSHSLGCRLL
jgi:hypothetical protein